MGLFHQLLQIRLAVTNRATRRLAHSPNALHHHLTSEHAHAELSQLLAVAPAPTQDWIVSWRERTASQPLLLRSARARAGCFSVRHVNYLPISMPEARQKVNDHVLAWIDWYSATEWRSRQLKQRLRRFFWNLPLLVAVLVIVHNSIPIALFCAVLWLVLS